MQLRTMEYVVAVFDCKSIRKASLQLFVSQPAISNAIQALENEIGALLFLRVDQRLVPTPAGRLFVEKSRAILAQVEALKNCIQELAVEEQNKITIGMSPFYGKHFFPNIFQAFHEKCPNIAVELRMGLGKDLLHELIEKKIDLWLTASQVSEPTLGAIQLMPEPIVLIVPLDYLNDQSIRFEGESIDLKAFQDLPFIMYEDSHGLAPLTINICRKSGFVPRIAFKTSSSEMVAAMVAGRNGVGFVPQSTASYSDIGKQCICYSINVTQSYNLLYNKQSAQTVAQSLFISEVKKWFLACNS